MKKINVQIYNPAVTKAPFDFITLFSFMTDFPEECPTGTEGAAHLKAILGPLGYTMRFYSCGDNDNELDVTVHNMGSPGTPGYYTVDHLKQKMVIINTHLERENKL